MAYGEVALRSVAGEVDGREYESPDKMLRAGQYTGASPYQQPIHISQPEAPEYDSVEDAVGETHWLLSLNINN